MSGRVNSNSELDERKDKNGGISWTTFQRSPGESKNGYFLCRNCGFEIIHASMIDTESNSEYIESLDQGNTKLENEGDQHSLFKDVLKCKQCEENVGFTRELKQDDNDSVTVKFFIRTETLVYENDSLTCENCGCDVDEEDFSTTVTYKRQCLSFAVVLVPIKNENGTFYDVKTFRDVIQERGCKECRLSFCLNSIVDICCWRCHALIGLKHVSIEENKEPFVGYILQNLNHDEGKINKDRSEAEPFGMNEYMAEEDCRLTKYAEADVLPQEAKEPSETTPLREKNKNEIQQGEGNVHRTRPQTHSSRVPIRQQTNTWSGNKEKNKNENQQGEGNVHRTRPKTHSSRVPRRQQTKTWSGHRGTLEEYQMKNKIRGWCLIINNMKFNNPKLDRDGSDKDEARLFKVFTGLKFNVKSEKDKSKTQMLSILEDYAKMDHNQMDCFVCCILSHGKEDEVVCCDNECATIEKITSFFRAPNCKKLAGKPKLFFFQACQGSKRMGGWQVDGDGNRTFKEGSIPDEADFLLGFSTTSGYVSFRKKEGSAYIQTLCEQLQKHAHQYDLLTIMTEVHRIVAEEVFEEENHKQMPTTLNRLRKQLYFNVKQLKD